MLQRPIAAILPCLLMLFTLSSRAQNTPPAPVPLWPGAPPMAQGTNVDDIPTLTTYLPTSNPTKSAVIVAPGGGYGHLSMEHEGSEIAFWLNSHGVAAFVLKYRLGPKYHHPTELMDAQRALRTVRSRAKELGISQDHVGMWGFSAGGHLTATAGTLYDQGPPAAGDEIDKRSAKPDFLILAYPVITFDPEYAHMGSRKNLLGDAAEPALVELLSVEKHVTKETPSTFLVATTDDKSVPVMNSVLFYSALVNAKVPNCEMHLFEHGPHGIGLGAKFPDLKGWPDLLATWMTTNGWMAGTSVKP